MNYRKRQIFSFLTSALLCSLPSFGCVNCMEDNDNIQNKYVGGQIRNVGASKATVLGCLNIISEKGKHIWTMNADATNENRTACGILKLISRLISNDCDERKHLKQLKYLGRLDHYIKFDDAGARANAILKVIDENSFLTEHPYILETFVAALSDMSVHDRQVYENDLQKYGNKRCIDLYFFLRKSVVNSKNQMLLVPKDFSSLSSDDEILFYQYQEKINKVIYEILGVIAPTKSTDPATLIGKEWVNDISNDYEMRLSYFDFVEEMLLK